MNKTKARYAVRWILTVIYSCLFLIFIYGQEEKKGEIKSHRKHIVEIGFNLGLPQQYYARQMDETLLGFEAAHLIQIREEHGLFIGYGLAYNFLQSKDLEYQELVDSELVDFREKYSLNHWRLNPMFRYYLPLDFYWFQPYLTGESGLLISYNLYTITDIEFDEIVKTRFRNGSFILNYALGGGANIPMTEFAFANINLSYLISNVHRFDAVDPDASLPVNHVEDYFVEKKAAVELWKFTIGITFAF